MYFWTPWAQEECKVGVLCCVCTFPTTLQQPSRCLPLLVSNSSLQCSKVCAVLAGDISSSRFQQPLHNVNMVVFSSSDKRSCLKFIWLVTKHAGHLNEPLYKRQMPESCR
eukprot:TRINITY_DN33743_c0_g1_i1.p2 TRINITY_DN33743_c0_g1~~TRINITY_DN33743_c0_g1_i1.p2  ORF type:complete len:110 (-),score=9.05 TRINITY_DN33743_c0_g1_i1:1403-1732(-)